MGAVDNVAVQLRIRDELMQFNSGSLHCRCEAFKILDFYDSLTCHPNDFLFVGDSIWC